ncbi:MAG: hypothetical protein Q4D51_08110 [Eubacteriales bacterium]|nr:hypothetical protein [Eubacteriales bacterium]
MTWQHETTGIDGHAILFGVNIFDYDWIRTGNKIDIKDPLYGQRYSFPVYKVLIKGQEYEFAAGEFSNSVFGFYVKKI